MKIFTRIALAVATFTLSASGFAQKDAGVFDLKITMTPTRQIPDGLVSSVYWTVRNTGTVDFGSGDTVVTGLVVNGDTQDVSNIFFGSAIAPNEEFQVPLDISDGNGNFVGYNYVEFEAISGPYDVCAFAYLMAGETNPTNNLACFANQPPNFTNPINVSPSLDNDWSADSVAIILPTNLDNFDIYNNENTVPTMQEVELIMTNRGRLYYTEGTAIRFDLALDEDTTDFVGILATDIDTMQNLTISITNVAAMPESPQKVGTFDVCAVARMISDENPDNDETCTSFRIRDTYIPVGQNEISNIESSLRIYAALNEIQVEGVDEMTNIQITDMQGRVIKSVSSSENISVNMADESAGVYIVRAQEMKSGATSINKVTIQ